MGKIHPSTSTATDLSHQSAGAIITGLEEALTHKSAEALLPYSLEICQELASLAKNNAAGLVPALKHSKLLERLTEILQSSRPSTLSPSLEDYSTYLFRAALSGREIVCAADVTDTLATITGTESTPYVGVPEGIKNLLTHGVPVVLISGDSDKNILEKFLMPTGLISTESSGTIYHPHIEQLSVLTQSGTEITQFHDGAHTKQTHLPGIPEEQARTIEGFLVESITTGFNLKMLFEKKYTAHRAPGYVEFSGSARTNDIALTFFPFGYELTTESRNALVQDADDNALRARITEKINEFLDEQGFTDVSAVAAGKSSIDIGTSDKGAGIAKLRAERFSQEVFIVYFGDAISTGGNDYTAATASDLAVQVGTPNAESIPHVDSLTTPIVRLSGAAKNGALIPYFEQIASADILASLCREVYIQQGR